MIYLEFKQNSWKYTSLFICFHKITNDRKMPFLAFVETYNIVVCKFNFYKFENVCTISKLVTIFSNTIQASFDF